MPTKKPAKAPKTASGAKRFSLVSAAAQQEMYEAISRLKPAKAGAASGAEIAEIAVCVALGESDPVIPAYAARGARTVRKGGKIVGSNGTRLAAATISAAAALLADAKATALVCAGKLEARGTGRFPQRLPVCRPSQTSDSVPGGKHPDTGTQAGVGSAHALC